MGGWTFASPALLGWAAAAAIPILLHLLMRRRYRDSPWAAMQFLEAALRRQARRLRLEQWLVLLVRTLLLLLAALAWAEPLSAPPSQIGLPQPRHTLWLLVVDDSYSMQYAAEERSLWDEAKLQVASLVRAASSGDAFLLVAMGKPPRAVVSEPVYAASDLLAQLDDWQPRDTSAELAPALNLVEQLLRRHTTRDARWQQAAICVFTDLQALTWNACQQPQVRSQIARLAESARLHVVPLGSGWRNAAVTRLELQSPVILVGDQVHALAEIRRFSAQEPRSAQATWLVDGQPVSSVEVDLATGSSVLNWSYRLADPGQHTIALRVERLDPLEVDNQRYQVITVREGLRVLCVQADPVKTRPLMWAMQPGGGDGAEGQAAVRVQSVTPSGLRDQELNTFDVVWLADVPEISQEEADWLARFVESGGALIVSPGDLTQASRFNDIMSRDKSSLLPARFGTLVSGAEYHFDPLEYRHPVVRPFAGQERAGLLTLPVWRYYKLELPEEPQVRVLLAYDNGDAAIVERDYGAGRVIVWSTAAGDSSALRSPAWNESAAWPSFVPLVHEMLWWACSRHYTFHAATVGEPLAGVLPLEAQRSELQVLTPRGISVKVPVERHSAEQKASWRFDETWWSGWYRVEGLSATSGASWYAVNVDPAEGDLSRLELSLIPSQFQQGLPDAGVRSAGEDESAPTVSWARPLWAAVLALLLLESFLAWRFGAARAVKRSPVAVMPSLRGMTRWRLR
ncbi:MAG: hypothetical protein KatS3mg110_2345 [Pirellulaceae bacterium]|nr:MAG: hypothetical protein KatS3mg110_2345 [Pirellulaceae bacterium]